MPKPSSDLDAYTAQAEKDAEESGREPGTPPWTSFVRLRTQELIRQADTKESK